MLIVFDAFFRAIQRAITRPARETLFTVVSREDKYKSKAVTDTFVYRGGDLLGAWTEGWLGQLGLGLAGLVSVAVPLAGVWAVLGLWLGRRQESMLAAGPGLRARRRPGARRSPCPEAGLKTRGHLRPGQRARPAPAPRARGAGSSPTATSGWRR